MGRICFVNTTPFWGGGEKWHLEAARSFRSRGHRVLVVGSPGSPLVTRAREAGIETAEVALGNRSWLNPLKHRRLRRLFAEHRVETVVFNGPADIKTGGPAARAAGVRQRVYRRGMGLPVRAHWLNRHLFTRVLTHVVANSRDTREALFHDMGEVLPPDRVAVIPNGIDLDEFDRRAGRSVATKDGDEAVIGTVGRLTRQKNHSQLLDVAKVLADEGVEFRLRIAGSGELADELREKAHRLGLRDRVEFLGFVDDVPGFLGTIDVFVLTSGWEGHANVIVEAGAAGRPIVAFEVSSNPEVVVDGTTGFLAPWQDVAAFADRVRTLVDDEALRGRMGAAARADVEARFTQEHVMDMWERFLGL